MGKQLSLIKEPRRKTKRWWIVKQTTYGGSLNYRKVARPFDRRKLVHAVFKSDVGRSLSFSRFSRLNRQLILQATTRYGVRIRDISIHHNHIHLLYSAGTKEINSRFLRLISAQLGRRYARFRNQLGFKTKGLWIQRPFTRLVSWGRKSLVLIQAYFKKNRAEALGFIPYQPRNHGLQTFLALWEKQKFRSA